MANASAKRTAHSNAETIKNLRQGSLASLALSLLLRALFRRTALRPTTLGFWLFALSLVPSVFLARYLERIGSPRRDPTTGALISAGEDLSRPGIIEWAFDVVYITWACQVGSGAFGLWVWWLYLVIPLYAVWKLWSSLVGPMLGFGRGTPAEPNADADAQGANGDGKESKRQEKLRKRSERGDPRVRVQSRS